MIRCAPRCKWQNDGVCHSAKNRPSNAVPEAEAVSKVLPAVHLAALNAASRHFSFFNVLLAELMLLFKGQRWALTFTLIVERGENQSGQG